jgi:hypothetical protein
MKFNRFAMIQMDGLFPFLYPVRHLFYRGNYFRGIVSYFRDVVAYWQADRKLHSPFSLRLSNLYPRYFDRYEDAGEIPKHYFFQDLWAAKKIMKSGVKNHYDIGSRLDSFISHCLVFCNVVMLDIRPLSTKIPGLSFIQTDAMNMKNLPSRSITSISSLHAIEHFGLGRYGDPIDPLGYEKAILEIQRVTKKKGNIYFGTPIGRERVEFNAHRVFSPETIVSLFAQCELVSFSVVNDKGNFIENTERRRYRNAEYSCGLFHFRKKE